MPDARPAPKLAVILPAYNARETITRAVESVLSQSVRDLELIAVDDGSADGTAERLAALAAADPRLRLLRGENGGPAAARNRGLDALQPGTEYVMFLDADDELPPGAAAYALAGAEDGADLTILGFTIQTGAVLERCGEPEQSFSRAELAENFSRLYKANLLSQAWGKLYRAELLAGPEGLRFPDFRWGEDRLFLFAFLERAERFRVLPESGYLYRIRKGESLISRYCGEKFQVCLEADRRAQVLSRGLGDADLRYMFAKSVFSCLTALFAPSCPLSRAQRRAEIRAILAEPQVRQRCRDSSGGLPTAVLCAVLRTGSVDLSGLAFRLVAVLTRAAPGLSSRIKHRK